MFPFKTDNKDGLFLFVNVLFCKTAQFSFHQNGFVYKCSSISLVLEACLLIVCRTNTPGEQVGVLCRSSSVFNGLSECCCLSGCNYPDVCRCLLLSMTRCIQAASPKIYIQQPMTATGH